jgi:hypothetical protein
MHHCKAAMASLLLSGLESNFLNYRLSMPVCFWSKALAAWSSQSFSSGPLPSGRRGGGWPRVLVRRRCPASRAKLPVRSDHARKSSQIGPCFTKRSDWPNPCMQGYVDAGTNLNIWSEPTNHHVQTIGEEPSQI